PGRASGVDQLAAPGVEDLDRRARDRTGLDLLTVQEDDRHEVAHRAREREERLSRKDLLEHLEAQLSGPRLAHRQPRGRGPLEDQLARDAREAPARQRRREELSPALDEDVRAGPLAQLAHGVREERLVRALLPRGGE